MSISYIYVHPLPFAMRFIVAKWTEEEANWHEFMDELVRLAKAVFPVVEDGMKEWFQNLCQTLKTEGCCSPGKLDDACRNCWEQELIRRQGTKFELAWRNLSGEGGYWQIAKLYMSPSTGRNRSNSAEETELSGLLCVLLNCPAFSAESKRIPYQIRSVVRELLHRSNDDRHLYDHRMGSVEKQEMFRLMQSLESWAKGDSLGHEKKKNQTVNSQSGHNLQPKKSPTDNHHFCAISEGSTLSENEEYGSVYFASDLPFNDRNEEENEQMRDQLDSYEKELQKSKDENATLRLLKGQCTELANAEATLKLQLQETNKEKDHWKEKHAQVLSAKEEKAKECENLRQLYKGSLENIKDLQRKNTEQQKENQELKEQVSDLMKHFELSDEVKKRPELQGTTVEVREQKSKKKHRRKHK